MKFKLHSRYLLNAGNAELELRFLYLRDHPANDECSMECEAVVRN